MIYTPVIPNLIKSRAIPRAIARAQNKLAKTASKEEAEGLSKIYTAPKSRIKKGLNTIGRATVKKQTVTLEAKGRRIGADKYSARESKKGVSLKYQKEGTRKKVAHAWKSRKTIKGIYIREGEKKLMTKGNYEGKYRQPLKRITGPSVVAMRRKLGTEIVKRVIRDRAGKVISHEILYETRIKYQNRRKRKR